MPRFRLRNECTDFNTHVNGIQIQSQSMLPGFSTNTPLKLTWEAYFDGLDLEAEWTLILKPVEAENLAYRILKALNVPFDGS